MVTALFLALALKNKKSFNCHQCEGSHILQSLLIAKLCSSCVLGPQSEGGHIESLREPDQTDRLPVSFALCFMIIRHMNEFV